ncbi:cytochrome P450 [Dietzia sp. 179-F 9C3 NHS]|uniref:cytochrome P450 n=1 Tax=Dietzia sp. 179-F 9C3 NHS TaxID=3374295 RepID=UPI00387A55F2
MGTPVDTGTLDVPAPDFGLDDQPDIHRVFADLRDRRDFAVVPYAGQNAVVLLTHDLVTAAFKDAETFPASAIYPHTTGPVLGHTIQCMDGVEHRRNRSIIAPKFRRSRITEYVSAILEPVAVELVDEFADRGHADLVVEFTERYPVRVICRLLGLPDRDEDRLFAWAQHLFTYPMDPEAAKTASRELTEFVLPLLAERRTDPGDDLLSELAAATSDDPELGPFALTDEEVLAFVRLLFPAGVDTTMLGTGNILSALLQHPEQLGLLREDLEGRALGAVWEGLRYEPPVGILPRICPEATTWRGLDLAAGTLVVFAVTAANRDPRQWPEPDRFDITREDTATISFGQGAHSCLGNWLALAEMEAALVALVGRLPNLRLRPGAEALAGAAPTSRVGTALRGPVSLEVEWDLQPEAYRR